MHPFAFSTVDHPAEAIAAHARDPEVTFIAGGTDLIGLMKDRAAHPERLLDINGLPDMARTEALPDGGLRIGALARMSEVAANIEVRRRFPVVAEALLFAASGQLRNMASIGGHIVAPARCALLRDGGCPAVKQGRRSLGRVRLQRLKRQPRVLRLLEACFATDPTGPGGALAAMDASVIVRGLTGERAIP